MAAGVAPPFQAMGSLPASPYPPNGYQPMGSVPFGSAQMPGAPNPLPIGATPANMNALQQPMLQPGMPAMQGSFSPPQAPPRASQPMDWDRVLMFYLFGILPLLFIPCMFVASAMDFLRYAFIVLCVIGLGAMWFRQMFTPSTRTTLSIVYAALCIVIVSMLLSGASDAKQTSAGMLGASQATEDPGQAMAPYAATTDPSDVVTPGPPVGLGESAAEQRLILFMEYWKINRTEDMVSLVQPSWATTKEKPAADLFNLLVNRTPTDYTIEGISGSDQDNSRTVTMSAYIDKNNGKDPVRFRFMIVMVKEAEEWYVDPKSLATNDVVTEAPTNANGSTTIGLATPAPETTVTPVPPPDTKLYYNPDGGKYYHADPNCQSIKPEFLPLSGSFLYKELGEHSNLVPCLKCGAPTIALSE